MPRSCIGVSLPTACAGKACEGTAALESLLSPLDGFWPPHEKQVRPAASSSVVAAALASAIDIWVVHFLFQSTLGRPCHLSFSAASVASSSSRLGKSPPRLPKASVAATVTMCPSRAGYHCCFCCTASLQAKPDTVADDRFPSRYLLASGLRTVASMR